LQNLPNVWAVAVYW